jgi:hypothetical protein
MKRKLTTQQAQEQNLNHDAETVHEFATAEEMLRHDAQQTVVPPAVERRLQDSLGQPSPGTSWWRKIFPK